MNDEELNKLMDQTDPANDHRVSSYLPPLNNLIGEIVDTGKEIDTEVNSIELENKSTAEHKRGKFLVAVAAIAVVIAGVGVVALLNQSKTDPVQSATGEIDSSGLTGNLSNSANSLVDGPFETPEVDFTELKNGYLYLEDETYTAETLEPTSFLFTKSATLSSDSNDKITVRIRVHNSPLTDRLLQDSYLVMRSNGDLLESKVDSGALAGKFITYSIGDNFMGDTDPYGEAYELTTFITISNENGEELATTIIGSYAKESFTELEAIAEFEKALGSLEDIEIDNWDTEPIDAPTDPDEAPTTIIDSTTETTEMEPLTVPEFLDLTDEELTELLRGKTVSEVRELVETDDIASVRVTIKDGVGQDIKLDLRTDRVNLETKNGKVTSAYFG